MEREDLSATSWIKNVFAVGLLVLGGIFYLAQPDWLGFDVLAKAFGGRDRLIGAGVGLALLVAAWLVWERYKMRVAVAELMEALHQLLYGKDFRRDREAIEILLRSLEGDNAEIAKTAYGHLCRLTGQSFAQDPKVWRAWWEANKHRFEKAR